MKKSSSIAPCRTSFVQRNDSALPADEERERPGERPELARARLLAEELPGERQRGHRDDAVQRQQEVRLGRADVHRDPRRHARERGEREQPRAGATRSTHRPRRTELRTPRRPRARGDAPPVRDRRRASRSRPPRQRARRCAHSRRVPTISSASPSAPPAPAICATRVAHATTTTVRAAWPAANT